MNPVSVLFYQVAFKYFSSGCFHIHRSMYRELSKIREISDWWTKRWNQDCQVEPVIILRARCQVPASARRPGVVAGNRRKCQFTPRTSRLLLLPTLIAGKGDDHLCCVGSNPAARPLLVSSRDHLLQLHHQSMSVTDSAG